MRLADRIAAAIVATLAAGSQPASGAADARALAAGCRSCHQGDTVIPSTEALWLAQDVPPERLKGALVSPAIEHVELKSPTALDKWALVHFMGQVIGEADATR